MRFIALRRAGTAKGMGAIIRTPLLDARGQLGAACVSRPFGQFMDVGRNVVHHPVPPTRARRCIRIIDGQGKALSALGYAVPHQCRRNIFPGAAEAIKHLIQREGRIRLDGRTGKFKAIRGRDGGIDEQQYTKGDTHSFYHIALLV